MCNADAFAQDHFRLQNIYLEVGNGLTHPTPAAVVGKVCGFPPLSIVQEVRFGYSFLFQCGSHLASGHKGPSHSGNLLAYFQDSAEHTTSEVVLSPADELCSPRLEPGERDPGSNRSGYSCDKL